MFDFRLRLVKEQVLGPLCRFIPKVIEPIHLTLLAFCFGIASCYIVAFHHYSGHGIWMWLLNRFLDGLDGSLARSRRIASRAGGFVDLLCDFSVYSLIPISVAQGASSDRPVDWRAIAFLEAAFHINNFVLMYAATVEENMPNSSDDLTSFTMRPALVEGVESAIWFTAMLAFPYYIEMLCWTMSLAVLVGVAQRTAYILAVSHKFDGTRRNGCKKRN
ncbi:CDP-alcohol phosphatidyltransferase family protein [Aspergillus tanneri]|uniref:CDP-alcohol phosphatidyltransferase n=1 Tax=Aspergillus tanneri TaxID=1220188 RepID=A0A5M9ME58_9EURO|nr:uncharacterized protein ATNIH1004_006681 [Aspergillus tanneri]KAA8645262.1 hypothetical protein ATNIH1004_006681 [Aspergillus tanneri]